MTDHELPDDVSRWPDDPYLLLGVDAGVEERGLKKAYAKLIRKFKPEHHPLQFSRIRAAYEQILERLTWFERWQVAASDNIIEKSDKRDEDDLPVDASSDSATSPKPPTREAMPEYSGQSFKEVYRPNPDDPRRSDRRIEKSIATAMQTVTQGDPASGYGQLAALCEQNLRSPEICIRLYWILRLFPKLDAGKQPADWLLMWLTKSELDGPVWDLYCSELKRSPQLVLQENHQQLLDAVATTSELYDLFERDLQAASFLNRWAFLTCQLIRVREKLKIKNPAAWARILFRVMDFVAWSSNAFAIEVIKFINEELQEISEFHFDFDQEFRRYDYLVEMRKRALLDQFTKFFSVVEDANGKSRVIDLVSDEFLYLTRSFGAGVDGVPESKIIFLLESWATRPSQALALLTSVRENASAAFYLITRMIRSIDRRQALRESPNRLSLVNETVREFLNQHQSENYQVFRGYLLDFCIKNGIEISEIVAHFENYMSKRMVGGTFERLRDDAGLEIAVLGIISFWAA